MRAARFGRIVNITRLVTRGFAFRSSYAAAKAALESITRTTAIELAADGITANAVAPGPTETELFRSNNPQGSEGEARYLSRVPMRRFGHPSEVAAAIAFLASNAAAFITGQTLFVDGGAIRASIRGLLKSADLRSECFETAEQFLQRKPSDTLSCLILDVSLPGVNGLDFQQQLRDAGLHIPIIFVTGHGDIPMSVKAMKSGAVEFLTKPLKRNALLDAIQQALPPDSVRDRKSTRLNSS